MDVEMTIVRFRTYQRLASLMLVTILQGCSGTLPPPPLHPNGEALWSIVSERCVPNQREHGDPAPCAQVSLADSSDRGFVVLKDRVGASQYLIMPTRRITGIEDPSLLSQDSIDYFEPAWAARRRVTERLHEPLSREDIGIAVNSIYGRSQDLLHLHVDCLRQDVHDALRQAAPTLTNRWTRDGLRLNGHSYHAIRIDGDETLAANPFRLLATGLRVRPIDMGAWTLVLTGMSFADGRPGFVLLAARADLARGFGGSGEELLDHACRGRTAPSSPAP